MKNFPKGLGMWIAFHQVAAIGGWERVARQCAHAGVTWLAVESGVYGNRNWSPISTKACIQACHDEGISVYSWHYSLPSTWQKEVGHMVSMAESVDGLIVDAEAEWQGTYQAQAALFGEAVRKALPETYVGHAPLAWLPYHRSFPYKEFGEWCDQVHPQTYWTELKQGSYDDMAQNCLPEWETVSGKDEAKLYAPIGVTYGRESGFAKQAPGFFKGKDLIAFLDRYSELECLSLYSYEASSPEAWTVLVDRASQQRTAEQARRDKPADIWTGGSSTTIRVKP